MKIEELQQLYAMSPQVKALADALGKKSEKTVFLDGLVASSVAMTFAALRSPSLGGCRGETPFLFIMQDAEEAGYLYHDLRQILGDRQVLFSNEQVGGDAKVAGMEGLHQATNATKEWFFIQKLKPGQKGYTELYVKFDGETEVNDYMDTYGKLEVAYAVELEKAGTTTNKTHASTRTGDDSNPWIALILMTLAGILALLTILSWQRDRKAGDQA